MSHPVIGTGAAARVLGPSIVATGVRRRHVVSVSPPPSAITACDRTTACAASTRSR